MHCNIQAVFEYFSVFIVLLSQDGRNKKRKMA